MVCSMFTTEEMRLKSWAHASPIDSTTSSSSPVVILAKSSNTTRRPTVAPAKINKPCFNFAKCICRFGDNCKYMHRRTTNGGHGNNSLWFASTSSTTFTMTLEQMMALIQTQQALLAQFGYNENNQLGQTSGDTILAQPSALHTGPQQPIS
ncbi:hybrid signal transduction histidine kinase M [Tanacetum coccineum]